VGKVLEDLVEADEAGENTGPRNTGGDFVAGAIPKPALRVVPWGGREGGRGRKE
jgi:hypothetical protein